MWFREKIREYLNDPQVSIFLLISLTVVMSIHFLGQYLIPVFTSIILAYILEGLIRPIEKLKVPRTVAVILVFIFFMTSLIFLILWIIPIAVKQFSQFLQALPSMVIAGKTHIKELLQKYPNVISKIQLDALTGFIVEQIRSMGKNVLSYSISSIMGIVNFLIYMVLVPLITFFLLKDKDIILSFLKDLLPENIEFTSQIWSEVNAKIARFLQGKMWEIVIVWIATYLFFIFIHLEFALLLSLFIGLSVLIPFVGAIVMTIPVALVAYFQWGFARELVVSVAGYSIIQFLDGNLLVPLLMSGFVNLHPVAIMIGVLVFGGLWGLWGVFFAIPLLTLIHTIIKTWPRKTKKAEEVESEG
ncbi:AI-2E family transporter [Desulfothermus okinawensis JCM 13304]